MSALNVLIVLLNILMGFGILALTNTRLPRSLSIPLSVLIGMFAHTMLLFMIEFTGLGISRQMMVASAVFGTVVLNGWWPRVAPWYKSLFSRTSLTLSMSDVITLGAGCTIGYYVLWAAWYWPVTPFDAMAGIDLVARQTISEGTIVNRVFTDESLRGHLSNQPFYAPFAMLMQVIYRLIGYGYGQVWLGVAAIAFSWFMWSSLRQVVHPFIANILWLFMIVTPEFLGYTYLLQTDYINAAFLACGVVLLVLSLERTSISALGVSAVLFAAACWSRTETIGIVLIGVIAVMPMMARQLGGRQAVRYAITVLGASLATFGIWNGVFVQFFLPVSPEAAQELVFFDGARLVAVVSDTFTNVLFDTGLWGLTFILFAVALIGSLVWKRGVGSIATLLWIGAIFIGLEIVGIVFTAAVVEQTLRRGIFKLIPLIFMFVAAAPLVQEWSKRLLKWEGAR